MQQNLVKDWMVHCRSININPPLFCCSVMETEGVGDYLFSALDLGP